MNGADVSKSQVMLPVGSVISVFALMMVSLAQKDHAYQVFLSHGVLFGIGISLLYVSFMGSLQLVL